MKKFVVSEKCIACGTCVSFCPEAAIELRDRRQETGDKGQSDKVKKIAEIDLDFCKGCGVCARVCPFKAIVMKKK